MKTLVCNAGSSSLKFSLFEAEGEQLLAEGSIDWASERTQLVFRERLGAAVLAVDEQHVLHGYISTIGRTSIEPPSRADGIFAASFSASSNESASTR